MKSPETPLVCRVSLPAEQSPDPHPTLILLHGRGADEEDLLGLAPHLDKRFLILGVRAPYEFPYGGHTWYDFGERGVPDPVMFKSSYEKLTSTLAIVHREYPIDPSRVFLFGFSMGTVMSYALALSHPEQFRGVVANSGYIPEGTFLAFKWGSLANTEFFVAHGTYDPVIPVSCGQQARDILAAAGAQITYKEYPMAHQISEESLMDVADWLKQRLEPSTH
jgi:phospholipase/carboxylesterase